MTACLQFFVGAQYAPGCVVEGVDNQQVQILSGELVVRPGSHGSGSSGQPAGPKPPGQQPGWGRDWAPPGRNVVGPARKDPPIIHLAPAYACDICDICAGP